MAMACPPACCPAVLPLSPPAVPLGFAPAPPLRPPLSPRRRPVGGEGMRKPPGGAAARRRRPPVLATAAGAPSAASAAGHGDAGGRSSAPQLASVSRRRSGATTATTTASTAAVSGGRATATTSRRHGAPPPPLSMVDAAGGSATLGHPTTRRRGRPRSVGAAPSSTATAAVGAAAAAASTAAAAPAAAVVASPPAPRVARRAPADGTRRAGRPVSPSPPPLSTPPPPPATAAGRFRGGAGSGGVDRGPPGTPHGDGGVPPPGGGPRRVGVSTAPCRRRQSPAASTRAAPRQPVADGDAERRRYLAQLRLLMLSAEDQLVLADLVRRLPDVGGGLFDALGWVSAGVAAARVDADTRAVAPSVADTTTVVVPPGQLAADVWATVATGKAVTALPDARPSPPSSDALAVALAMTLHRQYTAAQLCIAARDRLVVANLLLVERVVAQVVSHYGATADDAGGGAVPAADLVQEGAIALVRATGTYNPDRGVPFVHYAGLVVRAGVVRAVENHGRLVRLPVILLQRVLRVQRAAREVEAALVAHGGRLAAPGTAAAATAAVLSDSGGVCPIAAAEVTASVLGIPRAEVERLARLAQAGASLDAAFSGPISGGNMGGAGAGMSPASGGGGGNGCLLDALESTAPLPEQAAADAEAAHTIRSVMERLLDADERAVMQRLYGLCLGPGSDDADAEATVGVGGGAVATGDVTCRLGVGGAASAGRRAASTTMVPVAPAAAADGVPRLVGGGGCACGSCVDVQTKVDIARYFGWSRSHVRTVERRALSKMRRSELRGYRDVY